MNSKGEWGINIIPQLKPTEDGDLVADRKPKHVSQAQILTPNIQEPMDEFETQHAQRKRRRKMQRNEETEQGFSINVSEGARSAKALTIQYFSLAPTWPEDQCLTQNVIHRDRQKMPDSKKS